HGAARVGAVAHAEAPEGHGAAAPRRRRPRLTAVDAGARSAPGRHDGGLDLRAGSKPYRVGVGSYTIAEAAARSGFRPSTLRYYEDLGLVAPVERTGAGYRVYDDTSLGRLAFIARAKQLGCTLDEISSLVRAWDGQRCEPVQTQLRALVEA